MYSVRRAFSLCAVLAASQACAAIAGIEDISHDPPIVDSDSGDARVDPDGNVGANDGQGGGDVGLDSTVDACVADVANDPANCGRCGHSCGAGTCLNGRCLNTLASGGTSPFRVIVHNDVVYWSSSNFGGSPGVYSPEAVLVDGGSRHTLAEAGGALFGIAADNTNVYYAEGAFARYVGHDGGASGTLPGSLSAPLGDIAIGMDGIYVAAGSSAGYEGGVVAEYPSPTFTPKISPIGLTPTALAVVGQAFVFSSDANQLSQDAGQVLTCTPPCSGTPSVVAGGLSLPVTIVTDGTTVFFATTGDVLGTTNNGVVMACPVTGCSPGVVVADQVAFGAALALDPSGPNLYFGEARTGDIWRCPKSGCGAGRALGTKIISGQLGVVALAVDANAIYWGTNAIPTISGVTAAILRLEK
jgi:hypothetical protein